MASPASAPTSELFQLQMQISDLQKRLEFAEDNIEILQDLVMRQKRRIDSLANVQVEVTEKTEDQGQKRKGWAMRDCRKTYIACVHTGYHAKSNKKHESPIHSEAARGAGGEAKGDKCQVVGRVLPTAGRYRFDRISRISRSPVPDASGAKDVLHMITLLDGINSYWGRL